MTVGAGPSGHRLEWTTAVVVRATIAHCALGADAAAAREIPRRLGSVHLRPHQIDAAARVAQVLADHGGALLADEVGLGKTYVALALAHDARRPLVVAPAALLPMWRSALERVGRTATLASFERLSRAGAATSIGGTPDPDLVIVDEAHHARSPATRRYAALADLCARSPVLLLSATPLQNSRRDLSAQLALFLGAAARAMTDRELARFVVRRTRADVAVDASLPVTAAPVWVELPSVDDCLDLLLGLPPPVPASDAGDGGALLVYSLVRRWASSRAALRATLRRRLAGAAGLAAALEAGRYPSRAELAAWSYADGTVQLAFAELITTAGGATRGDDSGAELLAAVRAHEAAVRRVLDSLDEGPDPDAERARLIREIRSRHPGERIIAFAEAAETVESMFRRLRADGGVAMLRARGAAVSGGPLSRREALARFAPVAQGAREPHPSQRIDLLLATDLLSEGVNLQDAAVVIHLDLPWNPARLEQRVGRVSRLGSSHARVTVYALRPPAASERLLAVERRLRAKLATAGRTLGIVGTILPGLDGRSVSGHGAAEEWTRVHRALREWVRKGAASCEGRAATRAHTESRAADDAIRVAAVRSDTSGFVAVLVERGPPVLLASIESGDPSTSPEVVAAAMELASHADEVAVDPAVASWAIELVDGWLTCRAAAELSGADVAAVARARRRVLARISRISARAPRHARSVVSPLAADARRAALVPLAEGAERVLAELADASFGDEAWLRAVAAFGTAHARDGLRACPLRATRGLVALLLLVPAGGIRR